MDINIFFFSSNCKYCYSLMKMLKNIDLLKNFRLINTDNNDNIPPQIKVVPTLIIAGYSKILECDDAFNWVSNINSIKNGRGEIKTEIEYIDNNFSDLFSFIDNNNEPQTHNFMNPRENINYILTAPELDKIDRDKQIKIVNDKINNRKEQDEYFNKEMKKHNNK